MSAPTVSPTSPPERAAGAGPVAGPTPLVAFLHLAVLWGFAVAQPLFDLLGRTPEFFAARGSGAGELILLAVALTVLAPAALWAAERLTALAGRRAARALHLALVGALLAALALQLLKRVAPAGGVALLALAAVLGALAAVAYSRAASVRSFFTVLAPAPLVFAVLFLLVSPVARLTLGGGEGARAAPVATETPVVMVIFDELPLASLVDARGRIDAGRYPSFASLAGDATFFVNATTLSDQTTKAVPAILSGRRPRAGGSRSSVSGPLPTASDHPNSVFTLLGERYRHNVSEEVTTVCPQDLCGERSTSGGGGGLASDLGLVYLHVVLPESVAAGLPSVSDTWGEFAGDGATDDDDGDARAGVEAATEGARAERFEDFLAGVRAGGRPSLDLVHSMFPHVPWEYLPSGRRYRTGAREPIPGLVPPSGTQPFRDDFLAEQAYQRHLLQVGFADRLLGRLLERLRRSGAYSRAAIVVVADHGVSFRRGTDRRGVTRASFEDLASVPLLVKAPGQREGRVDEALVRTDEVLPTLADTLRVELPWRADGRSGLSAATDRRSSVETLRRSGAPIRLSAPEFRRRRAAAARRKSALFGAGAEESLYAIGPHPGLIGRAARALPRRPGGGVRARFEGVEGLRDFDPGSGFAPTHVVGELTGGPPRTTRDLALALNGRVVAAARSFRSPRDGREYFSALAPESALRPGRNEAELFEVVRAGGGELRLASLGRG